MTMKKLMISAAALMVAVAAHGQGSFLFNTRNIAGGNNVTFQLNGAPATGADLFVEVLAGRDNNSLVALTPTLPLNRTGAGAGYTQPFSNIYVVPGLPGGTSAVVGYRAFQGANWAGATTRTDLQLGAANVTLTEAPTPPNEVNLGTKSVAFAVIPEPTTLALGFLGLGSLLMLRRRS